MFGLSTIKIAVAAILGAAVASAPAYLLGRHDGRASLASELKDDRIQILKDGKEIDEEVLNADDLGLCAILGGCLQPDSQPQ